MPYSKAEQRRILMANGYDPDQWEAIPQDEYFAPPTPLAAPPVALTPSSSALGSAYRGAKRSAIPAASALLATAGAASLLGPGTQPLAGILLPLAAGLGTGFGVSYLQEKIKPTTPEESAQIQADVKEHPIASVAGEIAPNLLAMKPSISNLRGMFRSLPKVGASVESDALRQAIISQRLNAALGGGLGAVLEGGGSLVRGEPVSPLRVASAALGGALLNEPNKIGRALGFKGSVDLQPSLSARQPEGFTGPPRPLRTQIDERLVQPESQLTRVYRDYAAMKRPEPYQAPQPAPREQTFFAGPEGEVQRGARGGMHTVDVPSEQRLLAPIEGTPESKIFELENQITELDAKVRHLPVADRLPQQAVLDNAKAELVKVKANRAAELQAQRVLFVSPKAAVNPKPEYPLMGLADTIKREELNIRQKAQEALATQRAIAAPPGVAIGAGEVRVYPDTSTALPLDQNVTLPKKGQPNATKGSTPSFSSRIKQAVADGKIVPIAGKFWAAASSDRPVVFVRVGKGVLPFYRSAQGTGGAKRAGEWQPFFGAGKDDWIIKGTNRDITTSYGNGDIKAAQDWLNKTFNWPKDIDADLHWNKKLHPLFSEFGEPLGLRATSNAIFGNRFDLSPGEYDSKVKPHIYDILSKLQPLEGLNATNPKPEPQGNQPEYIGISQGKNLPANQEEVRSQEGKLPSRGSRVQRGPQKVAPIPDDWRVTVQNDAVEGGKVISPGYVQFDKPDNTGSFGPSTIAKAGHTAPDYSGLPTGQYTVAEANKALAVKDSAMRLELRSQLGLSADEVTKLLQAKSPFDRGMNLLVALQKKGIKVQVLKHTPEGHRVAIEQALKQAGEIVEQVTGKPVAFKAGPEDAGEVMHQVETELAKAPLTDLLSHPNNREVFDLLSALAARERIQQGIEPSLVNDAGDAALGAAIFAQRATKLNASMLGEDTQAHEIAHILLRDRIVSNDPLAMRGLALFGGDEERLVQALGTRITDLAKLKVEGLTLKRFTEWVKDFVSSIKAAWGNATEEDFKRVLARRMLKGDYQPARVVVNDPKEVAYQTLANKQQDNREGLEAALNARSLVAEGVPGIRPVVARIAREASPELAEAFSKVAEDARSYRGKLTNFAQAGVEGLSKAEQEQALAYAYSMKDSKGAAPIPVSDKVLDWWEKSFRPFMGRVADEMEAIGKKIVDPETGARYIHRTPYYVPEMLLEHVQDVLLNKPNSPEAKRYVDQIVKFNANKLGISEEEARGMWESRGHAEHETGHQGLLEYGPLSRSAGIGLPPELREQNLLRLVTRYGNRASMALAWHKNVVGDPVAGYLAGVKDQFGKAYPRPDTMPDAKPLGNVPIVASTVKLLQGDFSPSDMLFDTLSRGVKVNIMQTLTGAADLTTWWVQVLPYIHPSRLGNIAKAHLYVREGIEHGLEQGVIQRHAMQMQSGYESGAGTQGGWVRRFNGYWDTINAITGRDGLERVTRGLTQMAGEMEAAANVAHAFQPDFTQWPEIARNSLSGPFC
jgi:hypothetical protein